jgi:hypothetical protein
MADILKMSSRESVIAATLLAIPFRAVLLVWLWKKVNLVIRKRFPELF